MEHLRDSGHKVSVCSWTQDRTRSIAGQILCCVKFHERTLSWRTWLFTRFAVMRPMYGWRGINCLPRKPVGTVLGNVWQLLFILASERAYVKIINFTTFGSSYHIAFGNLSSNSNLKLQRQRSWSFLTPQRPAQAANSAEIWIAEKHKGRL